MKKRDTKDALKRAFMKLALTREINEITIKEIAAEANVNRTTFYLYFYDIYDVLADLEADCTEGFHDLYDSFTVEDALHPYRMLYRMGQALDADPEFGRFLTQSTLSDTLIRSVKNNITEALACRMAKEQNLPPEHNRFAVLAAVSGIMDAYVSWCRDPRGVTLEALCKQLSTLLSGDRTDFPLSR